MARPGYTDFTFEIKNEHTARLRDGLAESYGYNAIDLVTGEANTETKIEYIRRKIMQGWKRRVLQVENQEQIDALTPPDTIDIAED